MTAKDQKWRKYNEKLKDFAKVGNFYGMKILYYNMATFVEKDGRNGDYLRDLGYEMGQKFFQGEARNYMANGHVEAVESYANLEACQECLLRAGKPVPLAEAIDRAILPIKECTNREIGCRCTILPVT